MTDNLIGRINEALVGTTPGPWHVLVKYRDERETHFVSSSPDSDSVLYAVAVALTDDRTADARLIAAAPALLREAAEQLAAKDAELTILRGDVEFRDRQIASLMDAAS